MKYTAVYTLLLSLASVSARFNQQNPPIQGKIAGFQAQDPGSKINGQTGTLSGEIPNALIAAADACQQLKVADQMVDFANTNLKGADTANFIKLVMEFAHAEKNFNPFNPGAAPQLCQDASLPKSAILKGILPLVDPASGKNGGLTADQINQKTDAILKQAQASGKGPGGQGSVADQMKALGFTDFVGSGAAKGNAAAAGGNNNKENNNKGKNAASPTIPPDSSNCKIVTVTVTAAAGGNKKNQQNNKNNKKGGNQQQGGNQQGGNLQKFTGSLGGLPPAVTSNGQATKGFQVQGSDAFDQKNGALRRSCDIQHNKCANQLNSQGKQIQPCEDQLQKCVASIGN